MMLLQEGIEVLALGRKRWDEIDPRRLTNSEKLNYIQIEMSNIESLSNRMKETQWSAGDNCVFFNFAWGGLSRLSDLNVEAQMKNVVWAAEAIKTAKMINCKKFIHVGTMEEAFASKYLELDFQKNHEYNRHVVYSLAKSASRDLLKVTARQLGIDLTIATNSHVMGPNDEKDSFLQATLKKLIDGEDLIFSTGEQIFDVISVSDCAYAYLMIGRYGKENTEYWVGSGNPRKLRKYVEIMVKLYPSGKNLNFGKLPYNDISLKKGDFSIKNLSDDTGFQPKQSYQDAVHELYNWLVNKEIA